MHLPDLTWELARFILTTSAYTGFGFGIGMGLASRILPVVRWTKYDNVDKK